MLSRLWIALVLRLHGYFEYGEEDTFLDKVKRTAFSRSDSWLSSGQVCAVPSQLFLFGLTSAGHAGYITLQGGTCADSSSTDALSQHHQYLTQNFKNWPQNSTCHNHTYQWMKDKLSRLCDITVVCLHPPIWLEKQHSTGWDVIYCNWNALDVSQILCLIYICWGSDSEVKIKIKLY